MSSISILENFRVRHNEKINDIAKIAKVACAGCIVASVVPIINPVVAGCFTGTIAIIQVIIDQFIKKHKDRTNILGVCFFASTAIAWKIVNYYTPLPFLHSVILLPLSLVPLIIFEISVRVFKGESIKEAVQNYRPS